MISGQPEPDHFCTVWKAALVWGQRSVWGGGGVLVKGRRAYGPFRALRYHLEVPKVHGGSERVDQRAKESVTITLKGAN